MTYPSMGSVITAMITPFKKDGSIHIDEAIALAHYLVEHGTDTLLVAGTTGESPTLTHEEEGLLFHSLSHALKGKVQLMAGTGSNCTATAIASVKEAEKRGVDCHLQVVPYYNKPSQQGLYEHFKAISKQASKPILLYNIPSRTGINMVPETIAKLANIDNIVGIKEASGSVEQVRQIRHLSPSDFLIYSGDDALTIDFIKEGACGVVSVASHLVGLDIQRMIKATLNNDLSQAMHIFQMLKPLFEVLFINSNPAPLKVAMALKGFDVGKPRLPLLEPTEDEIEKIKAVLTQLALLD